MRIKRKNVRLLIMFFFVVTLGCVNYIFLGNRYIHIAFVLYTTFVLVFSTAYGKKGWIRPYSFMVLSFLVFVWMRYLLDLFLDVEIISIGNGRSVENIDLVAVYLGISIAVMCMASVITEDSIQSEKGILENLLSDHKCLKTDRSVSILFLGGAFLFFLMFLRDSIYKINVIRSNDYFAVNEGVLLQGYRYFTLGKYCILFWLVFSRKKDRFFIGSTCLMFSSAGYLMRGARGYAVMYFLMWLLFLSLRHSIRLGGVMTAGIGIVYMSNAVLSYRMGFSIASGLGNIVVSVLNSQGASVEQVFGSVIFKEDIAKQFHPVSLFFNIDQSPGYGIIVDRVRGTGFEYGGFGSSFFGEAYFLGLPGCFVFLVMAGMLCGVLERAYMLAKEHQDTMMYAQLLLFMTMPNLIYIGRSSLTDFISKTIASIVICAVLQNMSSHGTVHYRLGERISRYG